MKKANVVLVGIGGYGEIYVEDIFENPHPSINLIGAVEPYPERCRYYQEFKNRNIPVYSKMSDFFEIHSADLTVISTPIFLHTEHIIEEKPKMYVRGENLGFIAKTITYKGKAVHGSTPFDGVNALNAAALSILGIHSNRETFREEEKIRIHPIITKGGDVVNSVPDEVCVDTYSKSIVIIANVLKESRDSLMAVGTMALAYIFISALIIFNVEPDSFNNFFDAIYWATVSLTTVGYGDIYPITTIGKTVSMISSFFGIAVVALPSGIITAGYLDELNKNKKN